MSMHERRFRDHDPERVPFFVRKAVKCVPVGEFLQLRFQYGPFLSDPFEQAQILDGAYVLQKLAEEKGKTYALEETVNLSIDPWVNIARYIVKNISTPVYLAARRKVLNAAISNTIGRRNEYELLGAVKGEIEKGKQRNLLADRDVTNKIIFAVNINLF